MSDTTTAEKPVGILISPALREALRRVDAMPGAEKLDQCTKLMQAFDIEKDIVHEALVAVGLTRDEATKLQMLRGKAQIYELKPAEAAWKDSLEARLETLIAEARAEAEARAQVDAMGEPAPAPDHPPGSVEADLAEAQILGAALERLMADDIEPTPGTLKLCVVGLARSLAITNRSLARLGAVLAGQASRPADDPAPASEGP